jgi:hypothetical protein
MTTYNFLVKCQTKVVVNGVPQRLNPGDLLAVNNEQDAQLFISKQAEGSEHLTLVSSTQEISEPAVPGLEPLVPGVVELPPSTEENLLTKVVPAGEIEEVTVDSPEPVEEQPVEEQPVEEQPVAPKKKRTTTSAE